MIRFVIKRFLYMLLTIWLVVTATFLLMHLAKGDPLASEGRKLPPQIRQNLYEKYGLNKPLFTQYKIYLKNLVTKFDLGQSYAYPGREVNDFIKQEAPISAQLGLEALAFGLVVGLILGIIAALKKGKWPDYLVMFIAIVGITLPNFVLAAIFQYFFTVKYRVFPTTGWGSFKYTVLPALALSFFSIAEYGRFMRSSCIEVLNQDYILTAKSKGVSSFGLIRKHLFRNAITPTVTMLGQQIAFVFMGAFVIESIFSVPGIGRNFITCVTDRDYPVILGTTVFIAVIFIICIFIVDIIYGFIDPRVKVLGNRR